MELERIAETVSCAGVPYNMEDEGHRVVLAHWKQSLEVAIHEARTEWVEEHLEDILDTLEWIEHDGPAPEPEPERPFPYNLRDPYA